MEGIAAALFIWAPLLLGVLLGFAALDLISGMLGWVRRR